VQTDSLVLWHDIRGLRRLGDGRVVVANGTLESLILDSTGVFLNAFGGEGQGPGEFRGVAWLQALPGDTLVFYDPRNDRVSFFDGRGAFMRSATIGRTDLQGMFEDGTFIASWNAPVPRSGVLTERLFRELQIIRRHGPGGEILAVFDTVPGDQGALTRPPPGSPPALAGQRLIATAVGPFARNYLLSPHLQFWMAVGKRVVYVGSGGPEITAYGLDGEIRHIATRDYPRQPFTEASLRRAGLEDAYMGSVIMRLPEDVRPSELPATGMVLRPRRPWVLRSAGFASLYGRLRRLRPLPCARTRRCRWR
jgi:hypothetical protein